MTAEITLHDTMRRRKVPFAPLDSANVRLYQCGPTVYDRAHLGNARPAVVFDVLNRLMRHVYGPDHVTFVRNITDVDDKINARAREMQAAGDDRDLNAIVRALTDRTIGWYHDDMDALGNLRPDHEPRATDYIPQMVEMIGTLIARGAAYQAEGHVLFSVAAFPDYGRLSGCSTEDMIAGARVDPAPYKRNPMDFVLWKPSSPEEPGWDSPWGRGRPGWHIECSAMAKALLGETFDIHAGGIDLAFPHHENEIAQSRAACDDCGFARYWLHNEMLQVEGKKMSKSLGNFFTVRDLLDQGVPGEVIRFVLLSTHYRSPMDWTAEKVEAAEATLRKWRSIPASDEAPHEEVISALSDDLNTPAAIDRLCHLAKDDPNRLVSSARILGLLEPELGGWTAPIPDEAQRRISGMIEMRNAARRRRDFHEADRLRDRLAELGIQVKDTPDGTVVAKMNMFVWVNWFMSLSRSRQQEILPNFDGHLQGFPPAPVVAAFFKEHVAVEVGEAE